MYKCCYFIQVKVLMVPLQELFHSTVGPLRDVTLHYDSAGRSKGVAAVHFQRKGDGNKAFQQYNNRLIDGS
jgi:THO complex subunit 4